MLRKLGIIALIVGGALLIYWQTLSYPFYLDDEITIVKNAEIRDPAQVLGQHLWNPNKRTLPFLSFSLSYQLGALQPAFYRTVNLLLHLVNGLLVWVLVIKLLRLPGTNNRDLFMPATAAAVFLLHPLQTQPLIYISQQMAVMATTFYLLGLWLYVQFRTLQIQNKPILHVISIAFLLVLSLVCGIKSKQTIASIPLAFIAVELLFLRKTGKNSTKWVFGWLFFVFLSVGLVFLTGFHSRDTEQITRFEYLISQFPVVVSYLKLVLWPVGLSLEHTPEKIATPLDLRFLLSAVVIAGMLAISWWRRNREPVLSFGMLFVFIGLGIESSIIPIRDLMFEHRMYLPMAGVSMALAVLISKLKAQKARTLVAVALVTLLGLVSFQRAQVWSAPKRLWLDAAEKSEGIARPWTNLGLVYYNEGELDSARMYFKKALAEQPDHYETLNNLGLVYMEQNRHDSAIHYLNRSIALNSRNKFAYNNLGICWENIGVKSEALKNYRHALRLDSGFVEALINEAYIMGSRGHTERPVANYNRVLSIDPQHFTAHYNLGNTYLNSGQYQKALEHYRKALSVDSASADVLGNMGIAYFRQNKLDSAVLVTEKAVAFNPKRDDLMENLKFFNKKIE